jgi:hypothetical protein
VHIVASVFGKAVLTKKRHKWSRTFKKSSKKIVSSWTQQKSITAKLDQWNLRETPSAIALKFACANHDYEWQVKVSTTTIGEEPIDTGRMH